MFVLQMNNVRAAVVVGAVSVLSASISGAEAFMMNSDSDIKQKEFRDVLSSSYWTRIATGEATTKGMKWTLDVLDNEGTRSHSGVCFVHAKWSKEEGMIKWRSIKKKTHKGKCTRFSTKTLNATFNAKQLKEAIAILKNIKAFIDMAISLYPNRKLATLGADEKKNIAKKLEARAVLRRQAEQRAKEILEEKFTGHTSTLGRLLDFEALWLD